MDLNHVIDNDQAISTHTKVRQYAGNHALPRTI